MRIITMNLFMFITQLMCRPAKSTVYFEDKFIKIKFEDKQYVMKGYENEHYHYLKRYDKRNKMIINCKNYFNHLLIKQYAKIYKNVEKEKLKVEPIINALYNNIERKNNRKYNELLAIIDLAIRFDKSDSFKKIKEKVRLFSIAYEKNSFNENIKLFCVATSEYQNVLLAQKELNNVEHSLKIFDLTDEQKKLFLSTEKYQLYAKNIEIEKVASLRYLNALKACRKQLRKNCVEFLNNFKTYTNEGKLKYDFAKRTLSLQQSINLVLTFVLFDYIDHKMWLYFDEFKNRFGNDSNINFKLDTLLLDNDYSLMQSYYVDQYLRNLCSNFVISIFEKDFTYYVTPYFEQEFIAHEINNENTINN